MERITLFTNEALVQKSDRLEIHIHESGIVQRGENSFEWFHGDPIPFPSEGSTPYSGGYASTLDEAMLALVRAAMS